MKEALKLALEALEHINDRFDLESVAQDATTAITAIKEALAQPEQEPVGTVAVNDWIEMERAVGYRDGYEAALKQVTQPEQEPVAWEQFYPDIGKPQLGQEPVAYLVAGPYEKQAFTDINSANSYCNGLNKGFGEAAYSVSLLYTTPPKRPWVGLTEEEANLLWENTDDTDSWELIKKIEAKLKELNT